MANIKLVMAVVLGITAVVAMGVACGILGILSTKVSGNDLRTRLRAAAGVAGFSGIMGIITSIVGILYARSEKGTRKSKALLITFFILAAITLILYIVAIILSVLARSNEDLDDSERNSITASLALMGVGFLALIGSSIFFFSLTRGLSGKEALSQLSIRRRATTTRVNPVSGAKQVTEVKQVTQTTTSRPRGVAPARPPPLPPKPAMTVTTVEA